MKWLFYCFLYCVVGFFVSRLVAYGYRRQNGIGLPKASIAAVMTMWPLCVICIGWLMIKSWSNASPSENKS